MILLRHGQSEFNVHYTTSRRDPGIVDPPLTALGLAQAEEAAVALAGQGLRQVVVSPYTRALQTALAVARPLGLPVRLEPIVRERCAFVCDIGRPRSELERAWPDLDFSPVEDVWWPRQEEPFADVLARAARFRAAMAARNDWAETLVVSHWGFILALTGEQLANGGWMRCDPTGPAPEVASPYAS